MPLAFNSARASSMSSTEADVVQAAFAFGDHLRVFAVGRRAGDEFDHRLADRVERQLDRALGKLLDAAERDAEAVFPQPPARFDVLHDHADMLDTLDLRASSLIDGWLPGYPQVRG
jgi:hypothetical protein